MPILAYYDHDENTPIYYITPDLQSSSSQSSIEYETESSISGTTINSAAVPGYFIQRYGRQHTANESAVRWYPSDNAKRYILRHLNHVWTFGGRYSGPVKEILAPMHGQQPRALELGTRIGTWVQEMATEFPHVQFRSLDLAPIIAHFPRPNIVFEVYDFVKGLRLEDNSQDVVFLSYLSEIVIDYRAVLREAHRVLRPGGLIHIREFNLQFWDAQDMSITAQRTNPIGCGCFDIVRIQLARLGAIPDVCDRLSEWLAPGSDLWEDLNGNIGGFERIKSVIRTRPAYPHEGSPCMDQIDSQTALFMRHMSLTSARDMFSILRDGEVEAETADGLIEGMIEELRDPERCVMLKLHCVYATKRGMS